MNDKSTAQPMAGNAFGAAMGAWGPSAPGLNLPADRIAALQGEYLAAATSIWNQALRPASGAGAAPPTLPDRRFAASEWASNPMAAFTAQMYLLNARMLMELAESVEGDAKTRARVRFAVQQWIDAASPSNYLALNPEALAKALATGGQSITQGIQHLLQDVSRGQVSQTDESVFEVGRNVATTPGTVVFENDLFQLIEYHALTAEVYARPMLFVPPCINKYYILDLQPANSLIRHSVETGHRTFVMSWRNPDRSLAAKTWDDYIQDGPLAAMRTVQAITGERTLNTMGFCVGGTILSTALAVLAARGEHPAASVTLLTTLLDFSDAGVLDVFVDEPSVRLREATIGAQAPGGPGLLMGKELASTFSFLRPNDLVWNYVVGNYLKGEAPPPFDLLHWNSDSTNLPGPMYCWYLRHMYLQNDLAKPGFLGVCGEKVDLGRIRAPFFLYASREDHIVPWTGAYRSVPLVRGADGRPAKSARGARTARGAKAASAATAAGMASAASAAVGAVGSTAGEAANAVMFVLGASGHIAGVINPPAANKRNYWVNDALPASADEWLAGAASHPGSWWPQWSRWLEPLSGKKVAAPASAGSAQFKAIEAAPGRYVKARA